MALTRPPDLTFAYLVDTPEWNAHAQNWQYVYDASLGVDWITTWTTNGVSPSLGNATLQGKYVKLNKLVLFTIYFIAGSGTTFGSGRFEFLLPFTAGWGAGVFSAILNDVNPGTLYPGTGFLISTTELSILTASGYVGASAPFTWADGDSLQVSGFYFSST